MNTITIKARNLQVGDILSSGGVITEVAVQTLVGYNIEEVRIVDTGLKACKAWTVSPEVEITITRK